MVRRAVGTLAVASALGAQAFLIPASVNKDDKLSPFSLQPLSQDWQTVKLPCSECVLSNPASDVQEEAEGDMPFLIQGGANNLEVNVTTMMDRHAVGISSDHLIYPPIGELNKAVVYITSSHGDRRQEAKVSAESLLVGEETASSEGDVLIQMFYQIESVDNRPVTVDPIKVTAIKNADDELAIVNVEIVDTGRPAHPPHRRPHAPKPDEDGIPPPPPPHRPHGKEKPCEWPSFICKTRDFFGSMFSGPAHRGGCSRAKALHRLQDAKAGMPEMIARPFGQKGDEEEAPRRHGHHGKGPRPDGAAGKDGERHHGKHHHHDDDEKEDRVRPHHHHKGNKQEDGMDKSDFFESVGESFEQDGRVHGKHHGKHHGAHAHRHHHSKVQMVLRGALMILTPIFLGIAAAVVASIVGMVVGRLVSFVWMRFVRGGQRGYASVQQTEDAAEKAELPPSYEELPVMDEKADIKYVDDVKEESK